MRLLKIPRNTWILSVLYRMRRSHLCFLVLDSFVRYDIREQMWERAMAWEGRMRTNGDFLEFGVRYGTGFANAFWWAKRYKLDYMKFYAFDSFQGFPEITGVDAEGFISDEYGKGVLAVDVGTFKSMIKRKGVDLSRVIITPGYFNEVLDEETKKKLGIKTAAVVHVDCDLYESTVPVLDFITDYLVDGTLLMFGGWFEFRANPNRGEQRATREWLAKNPDIKLTEYRRFHWMGNSFIVHRD